ncbi:MAG: DUF1700 domain-containing protein [Lachnospiraceae bacterium]|nr:DUF1700 domain-containing protein [Lachnospiraceae bacterium]MBQ6353415.1 DUF1700 domain-containing protein [Lachnospiraceae bacterium]MBR2752860.1 DUF1700 domain-containing protein [Lachnospiraceae bacterium]
MTKEQFITSLRRELKKLPPEEVVSATEYYEEYFAEALDNPELTAEELAAEEARLIGEIGSPKAVAAQIKSEYASRVLSGDETTLKYKPTVGNKISATWWIILGVLAAPVGIPIAIALGAVVFSLWIAVFAVVISLYAGGIGILAGGLAALVLGIIALVSSFSTGLMCIGGGLALVALAVLLGLGLTLLIRKMVQLPAKLAHRSKDKGGNNYE